MVCAVGGVMSVKFRMAARIGGAAAAAFLVAGLAGCASPRAGAGSPTPAASAPAAGHAESHASAAPPASVAPATPRAEGAAGDDIPGVLTSDIQAGIEKHIAETSARNGGYFPIEFQGKPMELKLVRVHTEYLASLGPERHFACVDLANIDGNVYDVDFFLAGRPGAMSVTETTVHKLNGVPYYLWEQADDGTWFRKPPSEGTDALMGVVRERDAFEFRYDVTVPELAGPARMWLPIPTTDRFQTVRELRKDTPGAGRTTTDDHGNRVLVLDLSPADSGKRISMRFDVVRLERGPYTEPGTNPAAYLAPERLVPDAPRFRAIAAEVTAGKPGDLARARAIFDHTIETFKYQRYGEGWGQGDAVRACDARSGNCTDFHAYFIALCRAAGIPARFAIGAAIPSERNEGGIDGYHCWAEFFAEGKWWPVDLSEANKYSPLSTYYFGHHPANRVELSHGRDLILDPEPASGAVNFLAYPVLEVSGRPVRVTPRLTFKRAG